MKIAEKYWVLADQVMVSATSFATNLLLARMLGIQQYGVYSGIVLVQLLVLSLLQAGISGLAPVLLPRIDENKKRSYTGGLFWFHQAVITLLFIVGVLLFLFIPTFTSLPTSLIIIASSTSVIYFMQDYLRRWLIGTMQIRKAFAIDTITSVLQMILLFVFLGIGKLTLQNAIIIIGATYVPSVLLGYLWLKPGMPSSSDVFFASQLHVKDGKWMLSSALLQWTAGNFYVVAAGWWLGASALGALRLAQYIFGLLNVLLQAFEQFALPKAALLHQSPGALRKFLQKMFVQLLFVVAPVLIVLAVFGKQFLLIAGGSSYTAYSYVMVGLAFLYAGILVGYPVRIALRVLLLNKYYFFGYVLATAFSLITASFLIPAFGLTGVLIGMFLAQAILLGYWFYILHSKTVVV
jgi:O-antigen/teichoic acid export membrane protein